MGTWELTGLERVSTTEQVAKSLRDAVIAGEIPAGEQLREQHIAQMLETSRGTVREALQQLIQEGLVGYQMHRGVFVKLLSVADRLDVYTARETIECGVGMRLLDRDEPPLTADLTAALERLRECAVGENKPSPAMIDADIGFHQELVRLAESPRLSRAYKTLAAENRMLLTHHPPYPWPEYVREHEALLEAVRDQDPRLVSLLRQHVRVSTELIGDAIDAEQQVQKQ